jgi:hypothetical protein
MFYTCACYLPPDNSSRHALYDSLLGSVCMYQTYGPIIIFGDLNSRFVGMNDYITVIDDVIERNIIDFTSN